MTNSEYIKAIDMRRSRRTYRNKPLEPEVMDVIRRMVDAVNEESGLNFKFVEDGTPAFRIFGGKFSMIAVCGDNTQKARESCGYFGQSIVLQCVYHGLGTCWVKWFDPAEVAAAFDLPANHKPSFLLPCGYAAEGVQPHANHISRKPLSETVTYK